MTHDELLKQIKAGVKYTYGALDKDAWSALRAVVELHKPVQSYMFDEEACSHCSSEEDRSEILYPCPTIQAIEKELG
jgi:hypothetical protein